LEKTVAQAEVSLRDAEEALDKARSPFTSLQIVQAEADVATAESAHKAALDSLERLTESSTQELAQAESKIASSKLSLEDAREALDATMGPTTLEVVQAEADVATAESAHKAALDSLERLTEPSAQELAQAESKVASSKLSLEDAREALDATMRPTAQEVVQAKSRVTDARLAVDKASDLLKILLSGPDDDVVGKAQSQIDSALAKLTNAELDLTLTSKEWDQRLGDTTDSLEAASDRYSGVFVKWLGIELSETEWLIGTDTLLHSWGVDLESLFSAESRFYDLVPWVAVQGVPFDDPATRWNESVIYTWANFYPGELLATCDDGIIPFQGECIRQEMDEAWDDVWLAIDSLDTLETQAAKALSNADSAVSRAEEDLADAQQTLADLFVEADPLEIESAEMSVELARVSLQDAEDDLVELMSGPDATEVEAKEKQIVLAAANLEQAKEELTDLLAGPDPVDVAASRKQVDLAVAKVSDSEEALEEVLVGADAVIVALKEADVAASSAALASALSRLDQATLTAPWDAVVSAIGVEVGQQVNANTLAIEILDQTVVEVNGVVDEIDVLFVREGASASVTMDALPGQVLDGVVSEIAAAANNQQGVVSYPISVRVEAPPGLALPEGLSAVASVVIRENRGVLLVPLDALYGSFEQPIIRIMNNGQIEERPVSLGNSDDFWVVVEDGIIEGDLVVMQSQEASTGGSGFAAIRGQFGGFGGGFGGFGGGRGRTGVGR
jgi:RND family efflux transporter MFP subunit